MIAIIDVIAMAYFTKTDTTTNLLHVLMLRIRKRGFIL